MKSGGSNLVKEGGSNLVKLGGSNLVKSSISCEFFFEFLKRSEVSVEKTDAVCGCEGCTVFGFEFDDGGIDLVKR